ncbi:hypothetical protein [Paenibacillus eucommiae]|uniref:Uncharacterized protein n=1 Tax=Paenibacillus eucommiae TaxID=1355755 RepID=A0ABS4IRV5_9BACL|nr:hypothetical protein [Paenibacillus eucommiae]MBP1990302.1 hypothetical protein [Paenibacillus eucommiae]
MQKQTLQIKNLKAEWHSICLSYYEVLFASCLDDKTKQKLIDKMNYHHSRKHNNHN